MSMTWLDGVIALIVVCSMGLGFARGLVKEALSLGLWLFVLLFGLWFVEPVQAMLGRHVSEPFIAYILAWLLIIVVTLVAGRVIMAVLCMVIRRSALDVGDRILGVGFGCARGLLISVLLVMLLAWTPVQQQPVWQRSLFKPYLLPLASTILAWVPQKTQTWANDGWQRLHGTSDTR